MQVSQSYTNHIIVYVRQYSNKRYHIIACPTDGVSLTTQPMEWYSFATRKLGQSNVQHGAWLPCRTPAPMRYFHYSDKSGYKYPLLSLRILTSGVCTYRNTSRIQRDDWSDHNRKAITTPVCAPGGARTMCRNGQLENHATIMDSRVRNSRGYRTLFYQRRHIVFYPSPLAYFPCTSYQWKQQACSYNHVINEILTINYCK